MSQRAFLSRQWQESLARLHSIAEASQLISCLRISRLHAKILLCIGHLLLVGTGTASAVDVVIWRDKVLLIGNDNNSVTYHCEATDGIVYVECTDTHEAIQLIDYASNRVPVVDMQTVIAQRLSYRLGYTQRLVITNHHIVHRNFNGTVKVHNRRTFELLAEGQTMTEAGFNLNGIEGPHTAQMHNSTVVGPPINGNVVELPRSWQFEYYSGPDST